MATLTIIEGANKGLKYEIKQHLTSLGKLKINDVILNDKNVSRHHAYIRWENGKYIIIDLSSTNGTFVNEIAVESKVLQDGDIIRLGSSLIEFRENANESIRYETPLPFKAQSNDIEEEQVTVIQEIGTIRKYMDSIMNKAEEIVPTEIGSGKIAKEVQSLTESVKGLEANIDAIENAYKRLSVLYRIGSAINSSIHDPEKLFELIMNNTLEVVKGERGFIMLTNEKNELVCKIAKRMEDEPIGDTYSFSTTIAQQVLKTQQPIITTDAKRDPRFMMQDSVISQNIRSVMCVPIFSQRQIIGVIYVDNRAVSNCFEEADLELLMAISDQYGIAIQNARMLEQIRKSQLELIERTSYLEQALSVDDKFSNIIGQSEAIQRIKAIINKVAKTDASVLIQGENGTGKELVARAIHLNSLRYDKPFIPVNCGALAEGIIESELFGHEKGAFTGAIRQKAGKFELADKGTIFLDEIGDLSLNAQVKILRALEEQEFERVGGTKLIKVDVRVISATNHDLKKAILENNFREDLFYRINVVSIHIPPLRERKEDIPLLAHYFLDRYNKEMGTHVEKIDDAAIKKLLNHNWLGNVRELRNVIERSVIMCDGNIIKPDDILIETHKLPQKSEPIDYLGIGERSLEEIEKDIILKTLEKNDWNKTKVAKILGVADSTLYNKLKKYGLEDK